MASGQVNRIKRPNTWLQRPMLQNREESSCQTGAVHTWHFATSTDVCCTAALGGVSSIGQCNTSCSLLAGVSKAKVFRGR